MSIIASEQLAKDIINIVVNYARLCNYLELTSLSSMKRREENGNDEKDRA
jgi:hypothetical protein